MSVDTLDIIECAEFLKVDKSTALKLAQEGKLPGAKIGRAWVFLVEDLKEYLRNECRKQMRERQQEAEVQKELDASAARNEPIVVKPRRCRANGKAKPLPDLSRYDHILSPAANQV